MDNRDLLVIFMLFHTIVSDRKLYPVLNPGCVTSKCNTTAKLFYVNAEGSNSTLHYLFDFTNKPTFLLTVSPIGSVFHVDWANFIKYKPCTVNFTGGSLYSFGLILDKIKIIIMKCFCTKSKTYHCKVILLDEQELLQEIQNNSLGQHVLDTVFRHLNLIETSYFGLRFVDSNNQTYWLDTTKKVAKQLKGKDSFTLYFGVKYYAVDPCKLVEEITRYQFFLQVKQDILQGRLPVNFDLAAELGAYAVQSELGDYDPRRHSPGYVSEFRFLANQTVELENKIAELHKGLLGQLPAVAELNYLDKVKWLEMYAVDLHPVIGEDNVDYFLGLTPTGVIVLRNKNKVANYYWPRISKIYSKGKYFMLRVCDKNNEESTYGFETPSRAACKHLYKCCVEHHSFFRLVHVTSPNPPDVINTRFSSTRSEKLSSRSSQLGMRNPPTFSRTPSRRYQRRIIEETTDTSKEENATTPAKDNLSERVKNGSVTSANPYYHQNRSDSPRSTRSAPWGVWSANGAPRNSHSSHSPRSVRSAGPGPPLRLSHARRSSSVESQSSNDSRPCRRHKHRSRRGSDNESELSRCSSHSHRRHGHKNRRSSGSEYDHHGNYYSSQRYQLIESEVQWREVQRRKAEGNSGVHHANVIRPRSGYTNSGVETESELSSCHHHKRKHRKHRSRSRSPSESKQRLPEELKKHLDFHLVETEGMSEDQLREIPYTIVTTNAAKAVRVRLSPSGRPKSHHSSRRSKSSSSKDGVPGSSNTTDSPPPPYSESPVLSDLTTSSTGGGSAIAAPAVSVKHNNIPTQLPRLPSQIIRGHSGSNNSKSISSSTIYNNPTSLLVYPSSSNNNNMTNGNLLQHQQSSITSNSREGSVDSNSWLGETSLDLAHSAGFVTGLPPQPHFRRSYTNIHTSDVPLNSSRSYSSSKIWPNSDIRCAIGLPWSSITEELQTTQPNNIYSTLDGARRGSNLNSEQNNTNQNILEHRSTNGNIFRTNSNKSISGHHPPVSNNNNNTNRYSSDIEKTRKSATLVESGILGRHSSTPNGTVAWPNEKQFGWQPKTTQNRNTNYYHQWENSEKKNSPSITNQLIGSPLGNQPAHPHHRTQLWHSNDTKSSENGPLIYAPQHQIMMDRKYSSNGAEILDNHHQTSQNMNNKIVTSPEVQNTNEKITISNNNIFKNCNDNSALIL